MELRAWRNKANGLSSPDAVVPLKSRNSTNGTDNPRGGDK